MVCKHSKSFVFSAFFSLNLLVSGLYAGNNLSDGVRAVAPYALAAVVAKVVENRASGKDFVFPVGLINKVVPTKMRRESLQVLVTNAQGQTTEETKSVDVVDASARHVGIQVGAVPVRVSIPECKQLEKRPWLRRFIQCLNTDVVVPGANLKNVLEIAAVLKVWNVARPHLPAVPGFSKK